MKYRFPLACQLSVLLMLCLSLAQAATSRAEELAPAAGPTLPNPILFVTQPPLPTDYTTTNSVFGNQRADMQSSMRGGDLWIRYPTGTLKNLTAAAGYGMSGLQGANAISVRDPALYWDGTKAIFSMIVGAPTQQYQIKTYFWQLYEITGFGQNQTPVITKVPNQPSNYNNISPIYGTDDRIIFTTDRPRNGATQLYPQRDEYEEAPTVTGIWSLAPATGDLRLLNHAPSGDFTPSIDSYGRLIFTQWDHLQRDQQADTDVMHGNSYGTFNYADESASGAILNSRAEVFPEPRAERTDLLAGTNLAGHSYNQFFPWQMNEDGTEQEMLNHLGRHELHAYIPRSLTDDDNLLDYYGQITRFNPNPINNILQIREASATPGLYYGIDAPEFTSHAAGQLISLSAPPTLDADHIKVNYITHRDTSSTSDNPSANHSGLYRDPLPLTDGTVIVVHTAETRADQNTGTQTNPGSRYAFRLQTLKLAANNYQVADQFLTTAISKTISFWDPDTLIKYSGPLWELQPVEVRARTRPARLTTPLPAPEQQVFSQAGVDPVQFQNYLTLNNLAIFVTRNVTTRDDFDKQQPFNLRVPGGVQTLGTTGKIYDVARLQLFQADQIRGLNFGGNTPVAGRRVLAQTLHDAAAVAANPTVPAGQAVASVAVATDGSVAAFVPAQRALTWQLIDPSGTGVVRERIWVTFQPGEVRVCTSCHGLSSLDQAGHTVPTNQPQALLQLLQTWKANNGSSPTPTPTNTAVAPPTATQIPMPPTATATATKTPMPPTNTPTATATATKTPAPATATPTKTPVPPTNTPTATATSVSGCLITINNGAVFAKQRAVNVQSNLTDAAQIQISNDGGFTNATWQAYQSTIAWTLTDVGQRVATLIVHARFRTANGTLLCNGGVATDEIIFDAQAPTVKAAVATRGQLQVTAEDQPGGSGVTDMEISTQADFADAVWEPWQEFATVSDEPGVELHVRVRDGAGNESDPVSIQIVSQSLIYLPLIGR